MQNAIALIIVAAAACYLGVRIWRSIKGKPGCGSCVVSADCSLKQVLAQQKDQPWDV